MKEKEERAKYLIIHFKDAHMNKYVYTNNLILTLNVFGVGGHMTCPQFLIRFTDACVGWCEPVNSQKR